MPGDYNIPPNVDSIKDPINRMIEPPRRDVDGTRLVVTGTTDTCGIDIIEAVERPDKTFVLGLQFHPEIAVVQQQNEDFLVYFTSLVEEASWYYNTQNDLNLAA